MDIMQLITRLRGLNLDQAKIEPLIVRLQAEGLTEEIRMQLQQVLEEEHIASNVLLGVLDAVADNMRETDALLSTQVNAVYDAIEQDLDAKQVALAAEQITAPVSIPAPAMPVTASVVESTPQQVQVPQAPVAEVNPSVMPSVPDMPTTSPSVAPVVEPAPVVPTMPPVESVITESMATNPVATMPSSAVPAVPVEAAAAAPAALVEPPVESTDWLSLLKQLESETPPAPVEPVNQSIPVQVPVSNVTPAAPVMPAAPAVAAPAPQNPPTPTTGA